MTKSKTFRGKPIFEWEGYPAVTWREHPLATSGGVVRIHRVIAYEHFGDEVIGNHVHHINEDLWDWSITNLKVLTPAEHLAEHPRFKSYISFKCGFCGTYFERETRQVVSKLAGGQKNFFCSRRCGAKFSKINKEIAHGEYGRYRKGCRCRKCKNANNKRMRKYKGTLA